MGTTAEGGVDGKTREKDLTDYRRHEFKPSADKNGSIKTHLQILSEKSGEKKNREKTEEEQRDRKKA